MFTWEIIFPCLRILIMFKDPVVIMKKIMSRLLKVQLAVAWLNLTMPNQAVKNGPKAKKIKLLKKNFFLEKQLIKLSCTYIGPFHSAKFLKNS